MEIGTEMVSLSVCLSVCSFHQCFSSARPNSGVLNTVDDCPLIPDPAQVDTDNDGIGDVCDNCPRHSNNNQVQLLVQLQGMESSVPWS